MGSVETQNIAHVLEGESRCLVLGMAARVSIFTRDPPLHLVEEPLMRLTPGMCVLLKAGDGLFEHGDQEAVFTPLARRLPA
jgi:hypothetical protein